MKFFKFQISGRYRFLSYTRLQLYIMVNANECKNIPGYFFSYIVEATQESLPAGHMYFGPNCCLPAVPAVAGIFTCHRRQIYLRFHM